MTTFGGLVVKFWLWFKLDIWSSSKLNLFLSSFKIVKIIQGDIDYFIAWKIAEILDIGKNLWVRQII